MRTLLVGDTHANARWLEHTVLRAAITHRADLVIQLGDFGFWPGNPAGHRFIDVACQSPIPFWWIDGNHEHHDALAALVAGHERVDRGVHLGGNLTYLPRGSRFTLDGVSVCAVGGAESIDRAYRTPGVDWFAAERLTEDDIDRCNAGGPTDIVLSHDVPVGWPIPGLLADSSLAAALQAELPACWSHRDQLKRITDVVAPQLIVHGHYHSGYVHTVETERGETESGEMQVHGLDCDDTTDALAILECTDGAWSLTPVPANAART